MTPDYDLAGFASVPDYIYGITRAIWEDRGIGERLEAYYAPDINVRAPTGLTRGNDGVTAQTLQTLHQFPDRQLVGEDVIWTAAPARSFLSSHRLVSVMTHSGDGVLGRAQGRAVRSRIIADCWVQDGQVKEEWLVRDQAAFARCLGMSAQQLAQDIAERERAAGQPVSFFTPAQDVPSRYTPVIADDPAVARHIAGMTDLWGGKRTAAIRDLYFPGACVEVPGGGSLHGHGDIDRWVIGYLASFPDARFEVHSATVNRDLGLPVRIALRWSLDGQHEGWGHFGPPSGTPVHVMAISHVWMAQDGVRLEWVVIDEVSIWKQIIAHRGG
jgi:predicted ester cyclase